MKELGELTLSSWELVSDSRPWHAAVPWVQLEKRCSRELAAKGARQSWREMMDRSCYCCSLFSLVFKTCSPDAEANVQGSSEMLGPNLCGLFSEARCEVASPRCGGLALAKAFFSLGTPSLLPVTSRRPPHPRPRPTSGRATGWCGETSLPSLNVKLHIFSP